MTVTPSQNLSDGETVELFASGFLSPSTFYDVSQCAQGPQINGFSCRDDGEVETDSKGDLDTQFPVYYQMPDGTSFCDTDPNTVPVTECTVMINHNFNVPITFAGHVQPARYLVLDLSDDAPGGAVDGQTVGYTASLQVQNADVDSPISLEVTFPDGLDPQSAGLGGTGWSCGVSGQLVTCTLPSQAVGPAPTVNLPALVDVSDPYTGETLATTAQVSSNDAIGDQAEDDVKFVPGSKATCPAGQSCTASASSPAADESATVTDLPGQQTGYVTASFGGDVAPIHPCTATSPAILTFSGNRQKDVAVTATVSSEFKRVCYGQPKPFTNWQLKKTTYFNPVNKEYEGVLPSCKKYPAGPCVSSLSYDNGVEQVVVFSGAADPHFSH